MVDTESVEARLGRLAELVDQLDQIHQDGEEVFGADFRIRLATQHGLQLAIQTGIDIGAHLIAERNLEMPGSYGEIFSALVGLGLDRDLAQRLGAAAGMRNILVHDYLEVDDSAVWRALGDLDDLRDFAAFAHRQLRS